MAAGALKVLVLGVIFDHALRRRLESAPELELHFADGVPAARSILPQVDALVAFPQMVTALLADGPPPRLRLIQLLTSGSDALEGLVLPPAVAVRTAGDSYGAAVAEHAMALMLALRRGLVPSLLGRGTWAQLAVGRTCSGLDGSRLCIVGLGAIGRGIATRAKAHGMHVTAVTRTPTPHASVDELYGTDQVHEALSGRDALVLAAPLTAQTRGLIGAAELARLGRGAVFVNVSRGGLVDQAALLAALSDGSLAGAGLDVLDPEPPAPEDLIWSAPNTIITPHVAGFGASVATKVAEHVAVNLLELKKVLGPIES